MIRQDLDLEPNLNLVESAIDTITITAISITITITVAASITWAARKYTIWMVI